MTKINERRSSPYKDSKALISRGGSRLPRYHRTAYNIFYEETSIEIFKKRLQAYDESVVTTPKNTHNHSFISFPQLSKEIHDLWINMSPEDQSKFMGRAILECKRKRASKNYEHTKDESNQEEVTIPSYSEQEVKQPSINNIKTVGTFDKSEVVTEALAGADISIMNTTVHMDPRLITQGQYAINNCLHMAPFGYTCEYQGFQPNPHPIKEQAARDSNHFSPNVAVASPCRTQYHPQYDAYLIPQQQSLNLYTSVSQANNLNLGPISGHMTSTSSNATYTAYDSYPYPFCPQTVWMPNSNPVDHAAVRYHHYPIAFNTWPPPIYHMFHPHVAAGDEATRTDHVTESQRKLDDKI